MDGMEGQPVGDATPLGALLIDEGLLTDAQLDAALAEQTRSGKPLGRLLIESGTISEAELVRTLARQVGLEFVDLNDRAVDGSVAALVSESLARRYQAIPIGWEDGRLVVAMADPSNVFAVDDIRAIAGAEVRTVVATASQINETIERFYRMDTDVDAVVQAATEDADDEIDDLANVSELVEDAPIVKFVNLLVTQAVERPRVRHPRRARRARPADPVPHRRRVARGDAFAAQHPGRRHQPFEGHGRHQHRRAPHPAGRPYQHEGRRAGHRPSCRDPADGVRRKSRHANPRQEPGGAAARRAGLPARDRGSVRRRSCHKPYGTILATGPTGSGKSTTLYAALNTLNKPDRNIITVEDPVEYRMPGVNQVQINPKAGLTFASALRSILRSDPDIVLVGEIRDRETAVIAVEAALTGHLVLSTLHTNDAASTPLRLVEMGVEPFLVTSALDCVVAQRLARRLCDKCKESYQPTEAELLEVGWPMQELDQSEWPTLYRAIGCTACGRTGYKGRFALHEVMLLSEEIERLIIERRSTEDLQKTAEMQGMLTLKSDGLRKVGMGFTSLEEIFRVVI